MHKDESLWVKRLYRSIKPHHLANQEPDSLLGYDSNGTPVVIQGGSGITISGGTISAGGGGGTVTSVGLTAPTGLSVAGSPVTTSGTLALSYAAGYSIPTDLKQADWDTAFGWGNHASAGYATTTYVDNLVDGLKWKPSVKVATTGNITLSGEQTIDGVLTSANRVLVWQQSTPSENGIYVSDAGAWTRATDASTGTELVSAAVNVEAGSTYADIEFVNTNNSITIGVDNITFVTRASTTNHNNLSSLQGGTTNEYYHLTAAQHTIATAPTLANISSFSTNTAKSLYTMTSATPIEFRTSGASPLLYLDESNTRLGVKTNSPQSALDVTTDNLGVTQTNTSGIVLANNTAAAAGAQQMSPGLRWRGNGWKTNATASSQTIDFIADVLPVQGAANPTAYWQLKSSINGGAYSTPLSVSSDNIVVVATGGSAISRLGFANSYISTNNASTSNGLTYYGRGVDGVVAHRFLTVDAFTQTSNDQFNISTGVSFTPTSGTATYADFTSRPTVNQTGGSNGITRGIYVNPILTSASNWRSIETSNTTGYSIYTSTAPNYFGGNTGVGTTSADRLFHVEASDAATNTVTYTTRESHITSGTATTGFGVGKEWELENASGTNVVAATEEVTWSDATNGSEDAKYSLKLIQGGALADALTINSGATVVVETTAGGRYSFASRSRLRSPSDGVITLLNNTESDFNRLQFGGTTSSFPSLKRSTTEIQVRLADDSGDANLKAKQITATGRILGAKGADVASAGDLTLGSDGNVFHITGTTQINAITTTGWTAGSIIILIFDSTPTVKHNTAGGANTAVILLAGAADFSATANDTLTLVYDGTRWFETSRTVI